MTFNIVEAAGNYLCAPVGVAETLPPRIIFGYSADRFTNKSYDEYLKILKQYLYIKNRYKVDPKINPIPDFLASIIAIETYTDMFCTDKNRGFSRDQWVASKVEEIYKQKYNDLGADAELNAKIRLDAYFRAITNGAISYVCISANSPAVVNRLSSNTLSNEVSIELVKKYYEYVSNKNYKSVQGMLSSPFTSKNEEFFNRFDKVTVSNLRAESQNNQVIRLIGTVSYFYRNGNIQREERTFSVKLVNNRPVIVDTAFIRNLRN